MAKETTNQGYIDAQAYATDPDNVQTPDRDYQEYSRGMDSYGLSQDGDSAALNSIMTADTVNNRIGINQTSPSRTLHISSGSNEIGLKIENTGTSGASIELSDANTVNAKSISKIGQELAFYSAGSERMRIDSSGNVLVGKTAINTAVEGIELHSGGIAKVTRSGATPFLVNRTTSDGSLVVFEQDETQHGSISIAGSTTSYNTSSDYRLKENVEPLTGATERILNLKPSRFNFKTTPDKVVDGFLAHEVQDVIPEAVQGVKDGMKDEEYIKTPAVTEEDDDGNIIEVTPAVMGTRTVEDYQGIDQSKIVPLLVATIQELEARIKALEA